MDITVPVLQAGYFVRMIDLGVALVVGGGVLAGVDTNL